MRQAFLFLVLAVLILFNDTVAQPVEPWRVEIYQDWKKLKEPPITPYDGPFGGEARAFAESEQAFLTANKDKLTPAQVANLKARHDYRKTAPNGVYDPAKDPRPINQAYEKAILEDWNRMGYNCAYKGQSFTFMAGGYLKQQGLLGAIDQTLWGAGGLPPLQFDGQEGRRQREACGSFFAPENVQAGVDAITGMGHFYGRHLFTIGDHRLTCSWDEVGLRTRAQMDYRGEMKDEFRKFLKDVWFQDASPGADTNRDGRTYNAFTGQNLNRWDQVEPVNVSLDWSVPAWKDNGTQAFSAMPDVQLLLVPSPEPRGQRRALLARSAGDEPELRDHGPPGAAAQELGHGLALVLFRPGRLGYVQRSARHRPGAGADDGAHHRWDASLAVQPSLPGP